MKRPARKPPLRSPSLILFCVGVVALAAFVGYETTRVSALGPFVAQIRVAPKQAAVFRGAALQFGASVTGTRDNTSVHWSLVGPGSIDEQGLYTAPAGGAVANVVASAGSGLTDSATVQTVSPPDARRPLAFVSCYEDATIEVHSPDGVRALGSLSLRGRTAGMAIDGKHQRALVAAETQVFAIDLPSMRSHPSAAFPNSRFSQVALLPGGDFVVTDNNAQDGQPGVRIFRIGKDGRPTVAGSVAAGETPEGIALGDHGRTVYVGNINSDSVMRFALQPNGGLRRTGFARTGTRPFGIAVDDRQHVLFVADNDTATLSGARSRPGLERYHLPQMQRHGGVMSTGSATSLPLGVAVDSALGRVFVVNEGDGDVVAYDTPSMRQRARMPTGLTPWLPTIDTIRHRLYVPNARGNSINVYDTKTLRPVTRNAPACLYPTFIGLSAGV
ncbi:MAG: SMP-30/gluconolactonase/LRE family protein [Candidatus Eremiobacteraeota bacterium]|nr:SMP-30/gluconolactonase/LRE family protein [Candidatus Eremiobacteraeota bacterium]